MMIHYWSAISNWGVRPGDDFAELKKIRLLNQVCFVLLPFLLFLGLMDALEGDTFGAWLAIGVGLIVLVTPVLQKLRLIILARWIFVTSMLFVITGLIAVYGKGLGGEFVYMVSVILVLILFHGIRDQALLFSMIFGSYLFSQIYLAHHEAILAADLSPFSKEIIFLACISCLILLSMVFIQENLFFELQMRQLLHAQQQTNDVLREKQEEIAAQNEKLAEANEELEKFAYVASHDLKTPLRSINGFLTLIERRLSQQGLLDAEIKEFFSFATSGARQMHFLIDDILAYSRLNKGDIVRTAVDLNDVMKNVETNLREIIQEKQAIIERDSLPIMTGNDSHLLLLFQNIIENGIKYNQAEVPLIEIRYEQILGYFVISVADNGIGVADEYHEKIFNMFTRLHSAIEYSGSGIGLAICKKIVHACEGQIALDSVVGKGTTFRIQFPAHLLIANQESFSLER